jgi:hypothetical protein
MNIQKLQEFIHYDPVTGVLIWKKVLSNRTKAGALCGANIDSKGYGRVCFDGKQYRTHRVAWALFYGQVPVQQIDHINGNQLDNRIANLRLASNAENSRNCKLSKNNTSGVTGVSYHAKAKKWFAQIMLNRKNNNLGLFNTKEEAIAARKKAETQYFGQFAKQI